MVTTFRQPSKQQSHVGGGPRPQPALPARQQQHKKQISRLNMDSLTNMDSLYAYIGTRLPINPKIQEIQRSKRSKRSSLGLSRPNIYILCVREGTRWCLPFHCEHFSSFLASFFLRDRESRKEADEGVGYISVSDYLQTLYNVKVPIYLALHRKKLRLIFIYCKGRLQQPIRYTSSCALLLTFFFVMSSILQCECHDFLVPGISIVQQASFFICIHFVVANWQFYFFLSN